MGPPVLGAAEVELHGRVSVFSPRTSQVLMLNETASDVWRLCDGEHDLAEITGLLARAYRTSTEEIAPQVRQAVQTFVDAGILPAPDSHA